MVAGIEGQLHNFIFRKWLAEQQDITLDCFLNLLYAMVAVGGDNDNKDTFVQSPYLKCCLQSVNTRRHTDINEGDCERLVLFQRVTHSFYALFSLGSGDNIEREKRGTTLFIASGERIKIVRWILLRLQNIAVHIQ